MREYNAPMRLYSLIIGLVLTLLCGAACAQGAATWIWAPGDFEIWLSNRMQVQRVERDVAWPPFWRLYSHQPQVNFMRQVDLAAPEDILVTVEEQAKVGGWGAEVVAQVTEDAFDDLDAPPARLTLPDYPLPYSPPLEDASIPSPEAIARTVKSLL